MPKANKGGNGKATTVAEEPEVKETEEGGNGEAEGKGGKGKGKEEAKKDIKVIADPTVRKKQQVIYPEFRTDHRYVGQLGGLTEDEAKFLLGWRDEKQAAELKVKEFPKSKIEDWGYGDDFLFVDENDMKVRCLTNKHNRPFDPDTSHKYCQDILSGNWAGPLMLPEEQEEVYGGEEPYEMSDGTVVNPGDTITVVNGTINGETIVIGRYGNIISGQHRLIGFVWACQLWRKEPKRYPFWEEQPVLECLVVLGSSEDQRIVRTIDNVKPRQFSDVVYTSPIFADMKSVDKKECSIMAEKAVRFLWQRTIPSAIDLYQTHSESMGFIERHGGSKGKLMQAVRFLFGLNKNHVLTSHFKMSPGQVSGLLYLMGCSATNGDKYRSGNPPSEKLCNWDRHDKAEEFWQDFIKNIAGDGEEPYAVERAIKDIVDVLTDESEDGKARESATWAEKLVVLARVWNLVVSGYDVFVENDEVYNEIRLKADTDYEKSDKTGDYRLTAISNFGGIDLGSKQKKEDDPEVVESEKTKIRQDRKRLLDEAAEKHNAKVRAKTGGETTEPKSETLKNQTQTRKRVEQEQTERAADADFLKTWTAWSREGKLIEEGGTIYRGCFQTWVTLGRPSIQEFLADVVRSGKAKPDKPTGSEKPKTKIRVKASTLRPGNANK